MSEPMQVGELLPGVLAEAVDRAGPGYERWAEQVATTGYCVHPVRLRGRVEHADPQTGEVRTVYSTDREPDATLLKACGNRRASVCPSCSATYQADSFQLLAAGLRGGKGVPETVAGHPRLFVTFTAPSFGPVHSRRAQGLLVFPCHPYRQGATCPHGRRVGCWQRHDPDDPRLGEPLCGRCYQAGAQVLWNALAGRLWSRTTIYLYRTLAQLAGVSEAELRRPVRISFAKVAEYQKRGAIHFHAIGHKSASITLDRYGHLFPEELDHMADRLDRVHAEASVYPACTDASVAALGQRKEAGQRPASAGGGGETRTPLSGGSRFASLTSTDSRIWLMSCAGALPHHLPGLPGSSRRIYRGRDPLATQGRPRGPPGSRT